MKIKILPNSRPSFQVFQVRRVFYLYETCLRFSYKIVNLNVLKQRMPPNHHVLSLIKLSIILYCQE